MVGDPVAQMQYCDACERSWRALGGWCSAEEPEAEESQSDGAGASIEYEFDPCLEHDYRDLFEIPHMRIDWMHDPDA